MKRLSFFILLICLVCTAIVFSQNKALRLEGDKGHVSSDSPALNFTGDFTVSARIKATSGVKLPPDSFPNSWSAIITNSGGSVTENLVSKRNYTIWLNQRGFVHYTSTDNGSQKAINSPVGSISLDKWYFLSLTVTVNDKLRAYLNGKLLGETTIGTPVSGNSNFRIGWVNSVEEEFFNPASFDGVIDEVRLWNVARTEAELQSTMNSALSGNEEGLVGYWNFDDGTAKDLTTNENDGEFQGNTKIVEVPLAIIEIGDFFDPNNLDDETVSVLIQQLSQNPDANVRVSSAETLGRIGRGAEAAIPDLVRVLKDQDVSVRANVAYALGSIGRGAEAAIPALVRVLKDQDVSVRANMAHALMEIETPEAIKDAVPALIQLLQGPDEDVDYLKDWLVLGPFPSADLEFDFLTDIGGEQNLNPKAGQQVKAQDGQVLTWRSYRSKEAMVNLLEAIGKFENVTVYAYCEIANEELKKHGYIGSDDGVAVWINGQLVHKNNVARRVQLDQDLFEINTKKDSNRCLVKITQGVGDWGFALRFSDNRVLRENAAKALGQIGSEAAISALTQALQDESRDVRLRITRALARIRLVDAVPALIRALQDQDVGVRRSVAYALGQIGSGAKDAVARDAVPALIRALQDQDVGVRRSAADALGQIGSGAKDAVPALIRALQDQDGDVRSNTAWALGDIGSGAKDAVPDLIQALLQDEDKSVRVAVVWTLGQIGTPEALKAVEEYQSQQ